jgi:outer membrane immunogenic protein
MRQILVAGIGALAAAMQPALAADMAVRPPPSYKAPPVYVDPWTWTGIYVGLNAGYSWGRSETETTFYDNTFGNQLLLTNNSFNLDGWLGGAQAGGNWQIGMAGVVGIEIDIQATGQKGSFDFVCPAGVCAAPIIGAAVVPGGPITASYGQKLTWFGTVRGRAGALLTPTVLAYVTGGLAYGEVKSDLLVSGTNLLVPASAAFSNTTTRAGWTAGAGIEGRLGGGWTAKIEYLYVDLGNVPTGPFVTPIIALTGGPVAITFNSRVTDQIARVGINYLFGGPAPVRAAY